jgi:hypothetical protein
MSAASTHASQFYEQVVRDGKVFTFTEDGAYVVFRPDEFEVIPFWSSRSRMTRIQEVHVQYAHLAIDEMSFDEFRVKTLEQLEKENIRVGLNWSGAKLVGYDISVKELRKCLAYQIGQQASSQ